LIKLDRNSAGSPVASPPEVVSGTPTPAACTTATGKYSGATWDTLADSIVSETFTVDLDQHFAELAEDFRLHAGPDEGTAP
jgi:hypothetical protein